MPPSDSGSSISERAASASPLVDPQESLLDHQWEDAELEAALEEREAKRAERLDAQNAFKVADDNAKALLNAYELAVGEQARIGRFRIKKSATPPRAVSFETAGSEQLRISTTD